MVENKLNDIKIVVSVSPQAWASVATHYNISGEVKRYLDQACSGGNRSIGSCEDVNCVQTARSDLC